MRREAKLLHNKACESLILSIELFNRPSDLGRISGTLILLDHSFEMLLKAALLHKGARIREKRARETIGFDACVRRCLSDGTARFLTTEQALVLQTINGLRDAAQHHLLDISEGQLYMHLQSGVTLFRDLLRNVFGEELRERLPGRVLPISTEPPTDLTTLFDSEVAEIQKLLKPGRRRRIEAEARLRPLVLLDHAIKGEKGQPSAGDLRRIGKELLKGTAWSVSFPGVASVQVTTDGTGPSVSLRLSKKEGIPIQLVPEGTPGAGVVAVKRVDELGFYSLGATQIAEKLKLTIPKTVAVIEHLSLREKSEYYKEIKIGKTVFKRYSQKTIEHIQTALQSQNVDEIWKARRARKGESTATE